MDIPSLTSICARAYIRVEACEQAALVSELDAIMALVRSLPSASGHREPAVEASPLRPDLTAPGLVWEDILAMAPDSKAGMFRVPPVFEEGRS